MMSDRYAYRKKSRLVIVKEWFEGVWESLKSPTNRIEVLRALVTLTIVAAAAIIGTICYLTLSGNEHDYAVSQYNSVTEQGLRAMVDKFSRMNYGTRLMSKAYANAFPDLSNWPNVYLPGFYNMAEDMVKVSALQNVIFSPHVSDVSQLQNFTKFAYDYWHSEPSLPPYAGLSPAGPGIWSVGPNGFYVDTTGDVFAYPSAFPTNTWDVPLQVVFGEDLPVFVLGKNTHTDPLFGPAIDTVHTCVLESGNYTYARSRCGILSAVIPLPVPTPENPTPTEVTGLQSFISQPIVVRNPDDPEVGVFVGALGGMINWGTVLQSSVPSYVEGIDCVVKVGDSFFTYSLVEGEATFQGLGDLHDTDYNDYGRKVDLLEETHVGSFTAYTLTYYPRRSFFSSYQTKTPLYTTIGAIAIILFCCLVFAAYDISISREATRKEVVLDTKRRFVRFISHEIRTPLNTVRLGLKLLEMELQGLVNQVAQCNLTDLPGLIGPCLQSWLQLGEDILGNSDSAVDVLNDLLNYDKIEMGTLRLEFSSVEIWSLVKKTVGTFMMQAKQKGVSLLLQGECWEDGLSEEKGEVYEQLRVVGDSMRIAQVLRNLISNALKFTPEQGTVVVKADWVMQALPNAVIKVASDQAALLDEPRAGAVRISVTDSGAGLSSEQLTQVCGEGVQFNANQLQAGGGSGLGLFISKGMVEAHGGRMAVTSEGLGKGATFSIELPLFKIEDDLTAQMDSVRIKPLQSLGTRFTASGKIVPVAPSAAPSQKDNSRHVSLNTGPRRVLVVDDADSNRKLLMRILTAKGYLCVGACNGQEGVDAYQTMTQQGETVDAVLMDFEMPVLDGPGATKKLRELGCQALIIGVTGNVLPADIDHFKSHGANTVLGKPLSLEAFESHLRAFKAARKVTASERSSGPGITSSTKPFSAADKAEMV